MAVGTGIGLDLDALKNAIKAADKGIEDLLSNSKKAKSNVIQTFLDISSQGVEPFLNKLNQQKEVFEALSKVSLKGASNELKSIVKETSSALDQTNKLITVYTELDKALAPIQEKRRATMESENDTKAFQKWLELKDKEAQKNDEIERNKFNKSIENIGKQSAAYQKAEDERYQKWLALKDKERQQEQADADAKWQRQKNTVYQQNAQFAAEELRQKQKNAEEERKIAELLSNERIEQVVKEARRRIENEKLIRAEQKKAHDQRQRELEEFFREQERQAKNQAKYDSISRRERYKAYTTSYEGAIKTSDRAKTLAQEIQAIKNLEAARAKLNKTDADYQKKLDDINARIRQHNKNINEATKGAKELRDSHNEVIGTAGKLSHALATVFSIQAIRGYVNNLIKVRGEFELQQRSLQALLQSKDDADRLWQQTIDLAVKSPFRISELVSYTKQLAAYQIESEKLFETNKMLADVSAGLGVDMQRLILAFGQVKAANFLRGTELRQFTEAGVPMLEELARHFSELEGTAVSVGDVFERISKRMVSFSDVEAVFRNITSAGGDFYRMQEIQSETLKGQIRNLKDSIDLMLNSIGKATDSTLKWGVGAIKSLVDNWQLVTKSIKGVITALAIYKLQAALVSKSMIALANTLGVINDKAATQITLQQLLKVGWRSLINPIKNAASAMYNFAAAHPVLLAVTVAIAGLLKILRQWNTVNTNIENFVKKLDEAKRAANELSVAFQFGDTSEQRSSLLSLIGLANREYKMKIGLDADSIKDMDTSELEAKFVEIREAIFDANAFAYSFAEAMEKDAFKQWLGNLIDDDVFEDIDDFGKRAEQLDAQVRNSMKSIVASVLDSGVTLDDYQKQLLESLTIPKDVNESNYRYVERLEEAFKGLSGVFKVAGVDVDETEKAFRRFGRATKEVEKEFKDFVKGFKISSELSDEQKAYQLKFAIDKLGFEKEWGEFERDLLYRLAEEEYNVTIGIQSDTSAQTLEPWANRVYDAITKVNEKIKKENPDFKGGLFPLPQVGQTKEQYVAAAKAVIDVAKATYNDIQQIEDDSTVQRTKALSPYVTEVEKILNLFKDAGRDKGKDEVLEKLKNRINLIKEMNKEYEKLNKTFSKAESLAKVQKAYADTAKELGLDTSTMDFTDEGTIKSLEALLGKPEYAANKYVIELQKALDNFKVELGVEVKQEKDKDLKSQVQELFDQYDLSVELKKLNIPKDLAKSLFDVDYLDLDGLRKAVEAKEAEFIGTDMDKQYEDFLKKINNLSRKQREDEARDFVNFLKKNLNEIQVIQDKGAYNIALADRLFGKGKITAEQYMSFIRQIVEDTNKEVAKVNLEKFKDSATYIKAMGNLAAYSRDELEEMMSALQGQVGANAGNMGADEIRAYYEALERLVEQYDKIESPFQKGEINDLIEYLNLQKQLNQEKEKEAALEQRKEEINSRLNLLQAQLKSQQERGDVFGVASTQRQIKSAVNELKEVDGQIVGVASNILVISERVEALGDGMVESLAVAHKIVNEIANVANAATKIFDDVKSAADALGADTESGGWAKAGYAMEMVGGVSSELTQGLANFASGNFAGALANVVGMVTKLISGFAKIHDQNYQDIIEAQAKQVERLGKAYEKLELASEEAYSIEQLKKVNKELEENVELQIQSLKAMIAAENAKKNTDTEQIEAWNEELEALTQQWEDLKQSLVEGVGGVADYRSQTRKFVDSWVSAFQETGNGLKGLKNNFREFFDNIIAEQAALKVTEKFLSPFYKSLNSALEDLELSVDESKDLREEADKIMPQLSEALELIWNQLGGSRGEAEGGLSGLQKGIQGITEDTAQVIEAYLNSIRGYVSEQVAYTKRLYEMFDRMSRGNTYGLNVRMIS